MLVVLDRSGSMNFDVGGAWPATSSTRWDIATRVVKSVTKQYDADIRFGLSLFPLPDSCNVAANSVVPVADGRAAPLATALPQIPGYFYDKDIPATSQYKGLGSSTPLGRALEMTANEPELSNTAYANHVLVVTDGDDTCGGNPVNAVKTLFGKNIKTYVVGFAGGQYVNPTTLNTMAVEGGTARTGTEKYYRADDQQALIDALAKIAKGAANCSFNLQSAPPDPKKIFVYVNGKLVAQDTTRVNGWDYGNNNLRITLYGGACDGLTQAANPNVSLVYGCPDAVVGGQEGVFK